MPQMPAQTVLLKLCTDDFLRLSGAVSVNVIIAILHSLGLTSPFLLYPHSFSRSVLRPYCHPVVRTVLSLSEVRIREMALTADILHAGLHDSALWPGSWAYQGCIVDTEETRAFPDASSLRG